MRETVGVVLLFTSLAAWAAEAPSPAGNPGLQSTEPIEQLAARLTFESPLSVQLAAVESLRQLSDERVSPVLLQNWTQHGPRVHRAVVSVLLWRDPWLGILRPELANRPEFEASRDWALLDLWLRHPSAAVRARADSMRERPEPSPTVRDALARFQPALDLPGDAARGKRVFTEATCANCHQIEDVGRHIGPDLSRLVDRTPRRLLIDTIDPNRVVEHPYIEYTVVTTDGRPISGLLFDETEDQITLADGRGDLHHVHRRDIDDWRTHCRSQMTEGLEVNLTLQQMADLIAFIAVSETDSSAGERHGTSRP